MPGGKIQLEAYGIQNNYFNSNPDISYFKIVYKRYTNFSIETIKQYNDNETNAKLGDIIEYTIGRDGDLLSNLYLEIDVNLQFTNNFGADNHIVNYGHNIIDYIELSIGDMTIDKHYGKWLQIYNELNNYNDLGSNGFINKDSNKFGYLYTKYQKLSGTGVHNLSSNSFQSNHLKNGGGSSYYFHNNFLRGRIFIPFQFWFCKNPGLSLPLIALQYHLIKIKLKLNNFKSSFQNTSKKSTLQENYYLNNLGINTQSDLSSLVNDNSIYTLWGDYIFLDKDERINFAMCNHEYLIEQLQYDQQIIPINNGLISNSILDLKFNFPVKELIWTFTNDSFYETHFINSSNLDGEIKLNINNQDRISFENYLYFTKYQTKKINGRGGISNRDSIFLYSFSLQKKNDFQPMGYCNFSGINNISLEINNLQLSISDSTNINCNIYAINYNILRIMNGMGSILYSN